jgi:hypothetical protein
VVQKKSEKGEEGFTRTCTGNASLVLVSLSREDEKERRGRREGVRARGGEKVGWARREEREELGPPGRGKKGQGREGAQGGVRGFSFSVLF